MSLSSGAAIIDWSGWVELESSGASVAHGVMSAAASTECTSANHEDAPLVEFGAAVTFGTAPTAGKSVSAHYKPNTVDGTEGHDAAAPTATYPRLLGLPDVLAATTSEQYLHFGIVALPTKEFDIYLLNGDDTNSMTWKLYMRPVSAKPKA